MNEGMNGSVATPCIVFSYRYDRNTVGTESHTVYMHVSCTCRTTKTKRRRLPFMMQSWRAALHTLLTTIIVMKHLLIFEVILADSKEIVPPEFELATSI